MTMWDYRTDLGAFDRDLVGYDVEATDGSIGKIDESTNDVGASYLVVDTGFWIFGKKRMIPAGVVERIDDCRGEGLRAVDEGRHQVRPGFRGAAPARAGDVRQVLRDVLVLIESPDGDNVVAVLRRAPLGPGAPRQPRLEMH